MPKQNETANRVARAIATHFDYLARWGADVAVTPLTDRKIELRFPDGEAVLITVSVPAHG